jgi:hypothetical protein
MAYLKVGHAKFDALVKAGMPYVKVGKQRRYVPADIDEWLKKGGGDLGEPVGTGDGTDGEKQTRP